MAKLSKDLSVGTLHPTENLVASGVLGALNAEFMLDCDGKSSVSLDLRGTFSMTLEVAGTVDGSNWILIPMRPLAQASKAYVSAVVGAVQGVWVGSCGGFDRIRVRATAYTSGAATATLLASNAAIDQDTEGRITPIITTATGAGGAAVTLTIASPGAGLRQYLTYLSINRFCSTALTAVGTPVLVTTTNLPGSLVFTFPADGLTLGQMDRWREDFSYAIAASAQATAVTIVCPGTTGIIWRVMAGHYVAP